MTRSPDDANELSEAKSISLHSGKGGTGKTSIVANLGRYLADQGFRTLVVDMDFFTRGLSVFLARGTPQFRNVVTAEDLVFRPDSILNGSEIDLRLHTIDEPDGEPLPDDEKRNLFLLPASRDLSETLEPEFDVSQVRRIRDAFHHLVKTHKMEYVLIDARSGTDELSSLPALIAESYWIVTEEDRANQRVSRILQNEISKLSNLAESPVEMTGFVLNKFVRQNVAGELVALFEETIFGVKCMAAIPLSREVARTFINDRLIINLRPRSVFSREITEAAGHLSGAKVKLTRDRLRRRLLVNSLASSSTTIVFVAPVLIAFLLLSFVANIAVSTQVVIGALLIVSLIATIGLRFLTVIRAD